MTKLAKILMILLLGAYVPSAAQVRYTISPKNAEAVLKTENIRQTVEYLSSPSLGGRASGTDGGRKTAAWERTAGAKPPPG